MTDCSKRARSQTYEVTDRVVAGTNAMGLWLGTGWSIFPKFETADKPRAPIVRAQFELIFADGTTRVVGTDATWRTRWSSSSLLGVWDFMHFGGERVEGAVADSLGAVAIQEPWPGVYRVDFGTNFAGFLELKVRGGRSGDRVEMR